jgi:uncharacterized protein DUF5134
MLASELARWLLALLFASIAGYYVARGFRPGAAERISAAAHLAMCAAMIAMVWDSNGARTLQFAGFGLIAAWFAVRTAAHGRLADAHHAALAAAMIWMTVQGGQSMMDSTPNQTAITLAFGIYCVGCAVVWFAGSVRNESTTAAAAVCQGAMSVGMGVLLFAML